MKRTSKSDIEDRISVVVEWTMKGKTEMDDLVAIAEAKGWDVGVRQLWNYRMRADKEIRDYYVKQKEGIFGRQMARYEDMIKRARKNGDLKEERSIMARIDKITGLE